MNWAIFSTVGYVSIALWLCMPLLWLLHAMRRPRGWLCHVALVLGVAAFVLAKVNSQSYVNRIQVDRSELIEEQMSRQELARKAAEKERAGDVANIRFAEDASGDFLDKAGLDEADLKYFESFGDDESPEWKNQKKQRSGGTDDDTTDLESLIDTTEESEELKPAAVAKEADTFEPILMSDEDKMAADRLDAANLSLVRIMLGLAVLVVVVDYLRRLNVYGEAYSPLPVPSAWADAMTPRESIVARPDPPRRSLIEELAVITLRGETFVFMTDDTRCADDATRTMARLPGGVWNVEVLAVGDDPMLDDGFVFETLWYGRNSFVVDSTDRAKQMLDHFVDKMTERRETRARTKRTVHVVWDMDEPIAQETLDRFAALAKVTGVTLLLCRDSD